MQTHHSVVIARPITEVFAFVTDLRNEIRWQPEIVRVEIDGPPRAGAVFTETRVSFGRRFDWEFLITRFEPPHVISIETLVGTTPYSGSRIFEITGAGTRVTEVGELTLPWLARPLDPLVRRLARAPVREAYGRLRALLEHNAR